ncbi:MAG: PUA domain-containing protein [Acidimicrobiales bacterium]
MLVTVASVPASCGSPSLSRPAGGSSSTPAPVGLEERQGSLLPAGIIKVEGTFDVDAAVEVLDDRGEVFAKGQVSWGSGQVEAFSGRRTEELPDHFPDAVIHRDDLVLLPK